MIYLYMGENVVTLWYYVIPFLKNNPHLRIFLLTLGEVGERRRGKERWREWERRREEKGGDARGRDGRGGEHINGLSLYVP